MEDMKELQILLSNNLAYSQEILWSNTFRDTVVGSKWLKDQAFSPGRAAIGYPTLYALYRILDEYRPKSILELGLGQSTKMIGSYVKYAVENGVDCKHYIVEHDTSWIGFFRNMFELSLGTEVVHLNLIKAPFSEEGEEETYLNLYDGFRNRFQDKKFDLIFIDGPFGSPVYSRMDIIEILPECLSDSFVLMLDDAERRGEQNTLAIIKNILEENNIKYAFSYYSGIKSTAIITSADLHFLCTM